MVLFQHSLWPVKYIIILKLSNPAIICFFPIMGVQSIVNRLIGCFMGRYSAYTCFCALRLIHWFPPLLQAAKDYSRSVDIDEYCTSWCLSLWQQLFLFCFAFGSSWFLYVIVVAISIIVCIDAFVIFVVAWHSIILIFLYGAFLVTVAGFFLVDNSTRSTCIDINIYLYHVSCLFANYSYVFICLWNCLWSLTAWYVGTISICGLLLIVGVPIIASRHWLYLIRATTWTIDLHPVSLIPCLKYFHTLPPQAPPSLSVSMSSTRSFSLSCTYKHIQ